jgi:nucleoside-diphosphate-sugar epimerase
VVFDGKDQVDAGNELPYPRRYENHYSETKAAAERIVLGANDARLATVALRPHLVYGPGDPHLLPRLFERARRRRLLVVGDGRNEVSLTYVDNAAVAHVQAAARLRPGAALSGKAYFVADAAPVALWPWLARLLSAVGLPGPRRRLPLGLARTLGACAEAVWAGLALDGEPPLTRFVASQLARSHSYSLAPARAAFGYAAPISAEDAFAKTVGFWKERLTRGAGPR